VASVRKKKSPLAKSKANKANKVKIPSPAMDPATEGVIINPAISEIVNKVNQYLEEIEGKKNHRQPESTQPILDRKPLTAEENAERAFSLAAEKKYLEAIGFYDAMILRAEKARQKRKVAELLKYGNLDNALKVLQAKQSQDLTARGTTRKNRPKNSEEIVHIGGTISSALNDQFTEYTTSQNISKSKGITQAIEIIVDIHKNNKQRYIK